MVLAKIGLVLDAIAVLIMGAKFILFYFSPDHGVVAATEFIKDLVTFGAMESIPLEVTIIQTLGVFGVILIALDMFLESLIKVNN
jgi:hypothetical protein